MFEGEKVKEQSVVSISMHFYCLFSAFCLTTLVQAHPTYYLTVNMASLLVRLSPIRGPVHFEHHHHVSFHEEQLWSYHHPPLSPPVVPQALPY